MSIPPPPGPYRPLGSPEQPHGPSAHNPFAPPGHPSAAPAAPGPYAYHPAPYGVPAPVNGLAIGSLVLGLLCFVPAVGLVLGVVALVQIGRRGERGKGMAIAGSVLSTVGLVLWAAMLSTGAASDFWDGFKGAARGEGTAFSLTEGECFDSATGSLQGETYDVEEVPCSGAHDAEVFGRTSLADTGRSYPGEDGLGAVAQEECFALKDGYAMDTWAVPDDVGVYYLMPSPESWRRGDRTVVCLFGSAREDGTLTGALRNDASELGPDQVAFLGAVNAVDAVLYEEPEDLPEDDLAANRAWAKDVERELAVQVEALARRDWQGDARRPVAALVEEMRDARDAWARAAAAEDADTFFTYYEDGYAYVDGPKTVTARKALGLDTTVPTYEEGDGDGGGNGGAGGFDV